MGDLAICASEFCLSNKFASYSALPTIETFFKREKITLLYFFFFPQSMRICGVAVRGYQFFIYPNDD